MCRPLPVCCARRETGRGRHARLAIPQVSIYILAYLSKKDMDWIAKWKDGLTGWHRDNIDINLQAYLKELTKGEVNCSVLVTWCGKSLDLIWLCSQGHTVVGTELSEVAAKQFYEENEIPYSVSQEGEFTIYQASDRKIKFIVGNSYNITPDIAGSFDAVWDHNAFGAALPTDRNRYKSILISLLKPGGRILISNWEYGEKKRDMAPFSVPSVEVKDTFKEFDVELLTTSDHYSSYFTEKFNVEWAHELLHLATLK